MSKIYTASKLYELYRLSASKGNLSALDLCERGAIAFTRAFALLHRSGSLIHIFAGPGDTGASALAIARLLSEAGRTVRTYLFYQQGRLSDLCQEQLALLREVDTAVEEVTSQFEPPTFYPGQVIIDGLFGSDLTRPLEGGFASLVQLINSSGLEIVSIDLPSGLFAEDNSINNSKAIIRANHTLTFEVPRLSMLLAENERYVGQWQVLPLGISEHIHQQVASQYYLGEEELLSRVLKPRQAFSHKDDYGRALLIGGSSGRYGHLALASRAAFVAGCGSVEVATDARGAMVLHSLTPEAIALEDSALHELPLREYSAIAIGTASSEACLTPDQLRDICAAYRRPLILDATAIDLIISEPDLIKILPEGSILLIAQRQRSGLLRTRYTDLDYLYEASDLAERSGLTIVLKGTYTMICRSTGNVFFNTTGNAGMACAGVGDVLTGLLLGFMARGYEALTAPLLASHLLGMAADQCAARYSMESLTASQILDAIPSALRQLYQRD